MTRITDDELTPEDIQYAIDHKLEEKAAAWHREREWTRFESDDVGEPIPFEYIVQNEVMWDRLGDAILWAREGHWCQCFRCVSEPDGCFWMYFKVWPDTRCCGWQEIPRLKGLKETSWLNS